LGGASWPHLGGDGAWVAPLAAAGVAIAPLQPANCGFAVDWSEVFRDRFAGVPLKAVGLSFQDRHARGDLVITRHGLEGGAIYALAPALREAIAATGHAILHVALRPDVPDATLAARWARRARKDSLTNALRKTLGLAPAAIGLLREAALPEATTLADLGDAALARLVNDVPVRLTAPMPLDRAISTAGGVRFDDLDDTLMLRSKPGLFLAGEMLNWEAPTGGYLLQACFATGAASGRAAVAWARENFAAHSNQMPQCEL
ncbi:MAG: TIGR03862 family flavoprotein, partial [Beijerinckiaceae bacterium]|nr:TIGR03862 family flavoprotein [Beijerinckiaceae bacterium]